MSYLKNNVIACFVFCFVSNQIHADMGCENNRSFYNGKSGSIWLYKKNNQKYDLLVAVSSSRLEKLSKLIKSKSIIDLSLDMLSFDLLDKGNDKVYLIRFSGTGKDKPVTGRTKLKDILASKSETIKPVEIFKVDSDNFYLPSKIVWPTIFKDSHNLEDFDNPFIFGNINDLNFINYPIHLGRYEFYLQTSTKNEDKTYHYADSIGLIYSCNSSTSMLINRPQNYNILKDSSAQYLCYAYIYRGDHYDPRIIFDFSKDFTADSIRVIEGKVLSPRRVKGIKKYKEMRDVYSNLSMIQLQLSKYFFRNKNQKTFPSYETFDFSMTSFVYPLNFSLGFKSALNKKQFIFLLKPGDEIYEDTPIGYENMGVYDKSVGVIYIDQIKILYRCDFLKKINDSQ